MLLVYTPDEIQNGNALTGFDPRGLVYLYPTRDDESFYLIGPWCREGMCRTLRTVFSGQFPPGQATIYSIRGTHLGNSSHKVKSVPASDGIFRGLAQFIVELLASAIDDHIWSAQRLDNWKHWWNCAPHAPLPEAKYPSKMYLNEYPPEPKTQPEHGEAPAVRLGGWIDIPSSWLGNIPAMSLLMYLPRLWAAFNQKPLLNMLTEQSRNSSALSTILGTFQSAGETSQAREISTTSFFLWKAVARKLILPLWFTRYAKKDFWAFLFHLIRAAVEKASLGQNKEVVIPMPILVAEQRRVNGFRTWCSWYVNHFQDSPSTISVVREVLEVRGPLAVVGFRSIDV